MDCENDLNDLIKRIKNGETDLFEQIVLKYQNLVYTVCLNVLKNPHDAENTAQETFLSMFLDITERSKNIKNIKNIDNFKSWLCKIAVNKSIDLKRKSDKAIKNETSFELSEFEINDGADVETQIEHKERFEKLNIIISNIPEKYANSIKAFYFEQMSVKEIAKYYKLPEKTIETHLYRAKKIIKERWGENGY